MSRAKASWLMVVVVSLCGARAGVAHAADGGKAIKLTIAPHSENRRLVLAEYVAPAEKLAPPFALRDAKSNEAVAVQWEKAGDGNVVRWLVPEIAANAARAYVLGHSDIEKDGPARVALTEDNGVISVRAGQREVTRYHVGGAMFQRIPHKKPFLYPLMANGVNVLRGYPMEDKPNESHDHPHHTGVYFTHDEVNGNHYWNKTSITPKQHTAVSGPVCGRIVAENAWGDDLVETQDLTFIPAGNDVAIDWVITLRAPGDKPVKLGKTKEGSFGVRVATGLTSPDPGKKPKADDPRGDGKMVDALGNQGEQGIRPEGRPAGKQPAVWADDSGVVDGKPVGVTIMNHPQSWRFPTDWHVRHYGLFAANPFMNLPDYQLEPGKPVTLKYRLFAHAGTAAEAVVGEVYAGYANCKVTAE